MQHLQSAKASYEEISNHRTSFKTFYISTAYSCSIKTHLASYNIWIKKTKINRILRGMTNISQYSVEREIDRLLWSVIAPVCPHGEVFLMVTHWQTLAWQLLSARRQMCFSQSANSSETSQSLWQWWAEIHVHVHTQAEQHASRVHLRQELVRQFIVSKELGR